MSCCCCDPPDLQFSDLPPLEKTCVYCYGSGKNNLYTTVPVGKVRGSKNKPVRTKVKVTTTVCPYCKGKPGSYLSPFGQAVIDLVKKYKDEVFAPPYATLPKNLHSTPTEDGGDYGERLRNGKASGPDDR